ALPIAPLHTDDGHPLWPQSSGTRWGMTDTPQLPIDGPALIFGGPYSNLQATTAVLDAAARLGIPSSRVICTGDLVAYCGDPAAAIELVRAAGIHVVMGNCDEQLAVGAKDCGC